MPQSSIPERDSEGFLLDYRQWSKASATQLAQSLDIDLTECHWRVLQAARAYYDQYQRSPDMRPLVNWLRTTVSEDLGTSIALMQLFPGSAAKGSTARLVSQIAGLPKPPNCL